MRRKYKLLTNFIVTGIVAAVIAGFGAGYTFTAEAASISDIEEQIGEHENELENITSQIVDLETEQQILREQIDDLNAEITNTMACIALLEEEIAAKETEISVKAEEIAGKEKEIAGKKIQIQETQEEYDAAVAREEEQRQNMIVCARLIYERGESSYLDVLLQGKGFGDVLNQMDRVERVCEYENNVLLEYITVKNQVHDLWDRLEEEKAVLEAERQSLEEERQNLEEDRHLLKADEEELQSQKADLDILIARKKQESANYEAELRRARQDAAAAKSALQADRERLRQLQAAQAAAANGGGSQAGGSTGTGGNAASGNYTPTSYTATIDGAAGSDLGRQIAKFACQYIGNPYVYGGTSLTNGTDCSGFTYRVYSEFGYQLSRTSTQQRSNGVGVSYSEAQPGDLICYEGHVALYIGGGLIVHASSSEPYPIGGIKVSQAQYRPILAVRRIIN